LTKVSPFAIVAIPNKGQFFFREVIMRRRNLGRYELRESDFIIWLKSLSFLELQGLVIWLIRAHSWMSGLSSFEKRLLYCWDRDSLKIDLTRELIENRCFVAQAINNIFWSTRFVGQPYYYLSEILPIIKEKLSDGSVLDEKKVMEIGATIIEQVVQIPRYVEHQSAERCLISFHAFGRYCERFSLPKKVVCLRKVGEDFVEDFLSATKVDLPKQVEVVRLIDSDFRRALYYYNKAVGARFVVNDRQDNDIDNGVYRTILTVERPMMDLRI